jgi:hypothetical protein
MKILASILVASALTTASAACFAQPAPAPVAPSAPAAAPPEEPAYQLTTVNGRQVLVLRTERIRGTVARPYSFGLTSRAALGYTALEDGRSYLAEVAAAVRRDPF